MQARLDGKSIQHLLNLSLPVFAHPLMVVGMDFPSSPQRPKNLPFSRKGVWLPRCNAPASALLDRKQRIRVRPRSRWMVPLSGSRNGTWFPLRQHHAAWSERLPPAAPRHEKDLSDSEGFLLEFLAEMIHHAFLHNVMQKTSPAQSLHTVLLRALDDRMADYIAVSQALDALGWHSRHTYCCLYLQLSDMDQKT